MKLSASRSAAPLPEAHVVEEQDEEVRGPLVGHGQDPVGLRRAVDAQPLAGVKGIGNRLGDNLDESVVEVSNDDMEIFSSCHHPLHADRSRRNPVDRRPNGKRALLLYRPGRAKLEAFDAPGRCRPPHGRQ